MPESVQRLRWKRSADVDAIDRAPPVVRRSHPPDAPAVPVALNICQLYSPPEPNVTP